MTKSIRIMRRGLVSEHKVEDIDDLLAKLSDEDIALLRFLADGKNNSECGDLMTPPVTRSRIEQRIHRIKDKIGAATSAGMVAIAIRRGIID